MCMTYTMMQTLMFNKIMTIMTSNIHTNLDITINIKWLEKNT